MRRILVGLLAVGLVLGFGLSGLAVVKVGTLFSYTGPLAEFGAPEHDGAVLAAAQLNAAATAVLGAPIMELVREDAATDPKIVPSLRVCLRSPMRPLRR